MSILGNIAAAQTASAIGKYNQSVAYQQAAYDRKKAAVQQKVFDTIERPRFVKQQEQAYSNFFVNALRTGDGEIHVSTSIINQAKVSLTRMLDFTKKNVQRN